MCLTGDGTTRGAAILPGLVYVRDLSVQHGLGSSSLVYQLGTRGWTPGDDGV